MASPTLPPDYEPKLQEIFDLQAQIETMHPFLQHLFPVAIVEHGQYWVYDLDPAQRRYQFIKAVPVDEPLPERVRASFPLAQYDNRPVCVVTGDIFAEPDGYMTIFHEFVHCRQQQTCEFELKQTLVVAREAEARHDYMWELTYPFPYEAEPFGTLYRSFLAAAGQHQVEQALQYRHQLKQVLARRDYEYMVWQEWKEGLARFIENNIRRHLSMTVNDYGTDPPYDRVIFYAGGSRLIRLLETQEPALTHDIERLFHCMMAAVVD